MSRHIIGGSVITPTEPLDIKGPDGGTPVTGPLTDTQLRATAVPVSATSLPLPTGAAQDGTDITSPTAMPAGGVGIRGWLSSIWTKLNGTLAVRATAFRSASNQLVRPHDATPYTAGDVVGGLMTFSLVGRENGAGVCVLNPRMISSLAPVAKGSFKWWFFSAAPTVAADNAAFAPTDAEMAASFIDVISLDRADATASNTAYMQANFKPLYLKCGAATTSIYVVCTDANGYTPGDAETFDGIISGTQD